MSRPYRRLRYLLYENDLTQLDVARWLRVSVHTVSSKLNGHTSWTLDEAYELLELLGLKPEELPTLFPFQGRNEV